MVLTDDIDKTRDFYCGALGMTVGYRPTMGFPGYWCYLDDVPVVHIADHTTYIDWTEEIDIPMSAGGPPGTGAVDHVAFNCKDYDGMKEHLETNGFELRTNVIADVELKQIFLRDPNGLVVELNFHS